MSSPVQFLVVLGLLLQAVLIAVLFIREAWRKFPIFTTFVVYDFVEGIAGYALFGRWNAFFYVYTIGEALAVAFGIAVVYELFAELFSRHQALRSLAAWVLRASAGLLILVAAGVLYTHSPIGKHAISVALMIIEEAARVVELGCVVFLFLFSGAFGLHWRQWMFGIALGLGLLVAVKLLVVTMLPYANSAMVQVWYMISSGSYDLSILIWCGYLALPERTPQGTELPHHSQLEQWNQAILELIHQ